MDHHALTETVVKQPQIMVHGILAVIGQHRMQAVLEQKPDVIITRIRFAETVQVEVTSILD